MQFIRQRQQQVTTCPQCDNIVRIDAEVCNICGKRLREPNGKRITTPTQSAQATQLPPGSQSPQTPLPTPLQGSDEEEYEDEEYEDDEEYEEEEEEVQEREHLVTALPSTPGEIIG